MSFGQIEYNVFGVEQLMFAACVSRSFAILCDWQRNKL